jgi:1-deoxy-D-xylulose-5-phosphate reductoisomerase
MTRRVAILGATGSIGRAALEIVAANPDRLEVVALAAGRDADGLAEIARRFGVRRTALADGAAALAAETDCDVVLNAIVGAAGLAATRAALEAGRDVALANKESLVAAGRLVTEAARRTGAAIRPVDSEHASLQRCLAGRRADEIDRVILTASGGPFRGRARADLAAVTVEEALAHPTWRMGPKITVDSATLMNKGLELIEAHHLFGLPPDRIDVVVHPQSVVHALVRLEDGTMVGHMGPPDMRLPIQQALLFDGDENGVPPGYARPLDLPGRSLTFEPVDEKVFPAVRLAREALRRGGTAPAVLNAANEVAVGRFLAGEIPFLSIVETVERALDGHRRLGAEADPDWGAIDAADAWARREAARC